MGTKDGRWRSYERKEKYSRVFHHKRGMSSSIGSEDRSAIFINVKGRATRIKNRNRGER